MPHIESAFPGSEREILFCLLLSSGGVVCCFGLLLCLHSVTTSVLSPYICVYSSLSLTYQSSHGSQCVKGPDPGAEKPLQLCELVTLCTSSVSELLRATLDPLTAATFLGIFPCGYESEPSFYTVCKDTASPQGQL